MLDSCFRYHSSVDKKLPYKIHDYWTDAILANESYIFPPTVERYSLSSWASRLLPDITYAFRLIPVTQNIRRWYTRAHRYGHPRPRPQYLVWCERQSSASYYDNVLFFFQSSFSVFPCPHLLRKFARDVYRRPIIAHCYEISHIYPAFLASYVSDVLTFLRARSNQWSRGPESTPLPRRSRRRLFKALQMGRETIHYSRT